MRNIILGTDWWTDCDDAVAIRMLASAHKSGDICIKGVGINACMEYSASSLEGFLRHEGVYDIPLGIDFEAIDFGGNPPYQKRLSSFCSKYRTNEDAIDAVRLYRQILDKADEPVEIIEIGYMQVIANVIMSQPDDVSDKSGYELVKEKVSKIWAMAGKWDEDGGKENNFARNERSRKAANVFCDKCPVPITFLGWEVGRDVITGDNLKEDDILYKVLCDHKSYNGRYSWDPMLVHLAIVGDESLAGYDVVCGKALVDAETGENHFVRKNDGNHSFVVKNRNNEYYKSIINEMII